MPVTVTVTVLVIITITVTVIHVMDVTTLPLVELPVIGEPILLLEATLDAWVFGF